LIAFICVAALALRIYLAERKAFFIRNRWLKI
jgi:hypothetical protein